MMNRWDSYIVMSIGVGMTAAFCFVLFGPPRRELSVLIDSARTMRNHLSRGAATIAELSEIGADIQRANDLLDDYRTRVPATADVGAFVEKVSAVAERLGLRDWKVAPLVPEPHGSVMVLPVRISFESGFGESFSFLRDVERLPRAVQVTELVVERRQTDLSEEFTGGVGTTSGLGHGLRTELTMRIFYEAT